MSYEEFESQIDSRRHIQSLTEDMKLLVGDCIENLARDELRIIRDRMNILLEQGVFWIKQQNDKRYIYDLQDFLFWLCQFMEERETL